MLPAHDALMSEREPWIVRDGDAWILLATSTHPRGFAYAEPLEAAWGLACPLVGASGEAFVEEVRSRDGEWDVLLLGGVLDRAPVRAELMTSLERHYELREANTTVRHVASLAGGIDGFLARRSRNFRRSLQRAVWRAEQQGVAFDVCDAAEPDPAYERVLAVERRSWKGRARVGIDGGGMGEFYRLMTRRLAARGALRLMFAQRDGQDLAYILGGVFDGTYRGLQFAFDADCTDLALGNVCQYRQLEALCDAGISDYDLGTTGGGYKRRWAEREVASTLVLAVNR